MRFWVPPLFLVLFLFLSLGAQEPPNFGDGVRELTDFSAGGWNRRLGPDASGDKRKSGLIYQPPSKPCPFARNNGGMTYEIGGPPVKEAGDYSSTQAQVLYVNGGGAGVDRILVLDMQNKCFSEKPEPPWWGGFRPEPAVSEWQKKAASPAMPVGIARGLGTWSNHGVLVFSNGLVATAGTATSQGTHPVLHLPPEKIPTAMTVTPRNELALITVVDVKKKIGQLAVISLESCAPNFAHDWHERYPMLPNVGSYSDLKLLGFVDLPVKLPSGLSAAGNSGGGWLHASNGQNALPPAINLSDARIRESFLKGNNDGWMSTRGSVVVISKAENKAVFVDLGPLLSGVKAAYTASAESFAKTRDLGPKPKQWPTTFEAEPSLKPVVVGSVDVAKPVSVHVRGTGGEHARVYVGCQEGEIVSFKGFGASDPAAIQEAGRFEVGKNPIWICPFKGAPGGADYSFIVVSRGTRALQWVKIDKDKGTITRELRDDRLLDPVYAEVADTHGLSTLIVSVADFKGRKIVNYRCSPVSFDTNGGGRFGCGPKGEDEFECGGVMVFPGPPIAVCGSNVN